MLSGRTSSLPLEYQCLFLLCSVLGRVVISVLEAMAQFLLYRLTKEGTYPGHGWQPPHKVEVGPVALTVRTIRQTKDDDNIRFKYF